MAKWGEGDPRWIVEERPDATNVNNWHWTEKNACAWSQEKIKELFKDTVIEVDGIKCKVDVDKCEGEAVANNRKGKLIFFYEWYIGLKWKCPSEKDPKKNIEGRINIPNLSEENDISEVDIEFTLKDSTDEGERIKQLLHTKGKDCIREKLDKYVSSLKEEFTKGMILPKKENITDKITKITSGFSAKMQMNAVIDSNNDQSVGNKIDTTTLKQQQKFMCRAHDFYKVMTTPEMAVAFTKGPVKLEAKKEGKFEFFGGNIYGEFVDIAPTKIVQKWRCKSWPAGHFSEVTMDISEKSDHTEVSITQTGIPESEEKSTEENWERYYWEAIKRTFGFGFFM